MKKIFFIIILILLVISTILIVYFAKEERVELDDDCKDLISPENYKCYYDTATNFNDIKICNQSGVFQNECEKIINGEPYCEINPKVIRKNIPVEISFQINLSEDNLGMNIVDCYKGGGETTYLSNSLITGPIRELSSKCSYNENRTEEQYIFSFMNTNSECKAYIILE